MGRVLEGVGGGYAGDGEGAACWKMEMWLLVEV